MMGCRLLALHGDLHPTSTIKIQKLSPQTHTKLPSPSAHHAKKKDISMQAIFSSSA